MREKFIGFDLFIIYIYNKITLTQRIIKKQREIFAFLLFNYYNIFMSFLSIDSFATTSLAVTNIQLSWITVLLVLIFSVLLLDLIRRVFSFHK